MFSSFVLLQVQQMDMDHNGMISYGEFMKFFAKGQKEDTVVHKKVVGVSVDEARQVCALRTSCFLYMYAHAAPCAAVCRADNCAVPCLAKSHTGLHRFESAAAGSRAQPKR